MLYDYFRRLIANRPAPKVAQIIGGKCGFFFFGLNEMPMTGADWVNRFQNIWRKFSKMN